MISRARISVAHSEALRSVPKHSWGIHEGMCSFSDAARGSVEKKYLSTLFEG